MVDGGKVVGYRRAGPGAFVVELTGRPGDADEGPLLDAWTRATSDGAELLALDLGGAEPTVEALGLLVKLHCWCDQRGQRATAFAASALWRHLLELTGLDGGIVACAGEAEALAPSPPQPAPRREPVEGDGPWTRAVPPGKAVRGPLQGFGPLWEKTHAVRLAGATATAGEVLAAWRAHFGEFWPTGNGFEAPEGLGAGSAVRFRIAGPAGLPLSAGGLVLHAGDDGFTLLTLEGHLQAGWITFSVGDDGETPVARVRSLARSGDPLYEAGFLLAGHRQQEQFWHHTLQALAQRFGIAGLATTTAVCVDPRPQWGQAPNTAQNAGVRAAFDLAAGLAGRILGRAPR